MPTDLTQSRKCPIWYPDFTLNPSAASNSVMKRKALTSFDFKEL